MKKRLLILSIALSLIAPLSGCKTLDTKNKADKLERSLTHYGAALRWARLREAISFHVTKAGKAAEVNIENLEQFGVTSFDIVSKQYVPKSDKEGTDEAIINAEMKYFHKEQGTIRKLRLNQLWWYNEEINTWLIETEFPKFK